MGPIPGQSRFDLAFQPASVMLGCVEKKKELQIHRRLGESGPASQEKEGFLGHFYSH